MLFNRYREVNERCLELGANMDSISNEEGAELRRLLEEQAWLSKTIARQAKGALEEVRQSLGQIENWINEAQAQVEKALDDRGVPSDIFALEDVIKKASPLRDKARSLVSGEGIKAMNVNKKLKYREGEIYPCGADIRIDFTECAGEQDMATSKSEINTGVEEVAITAPQLDMPDDEIKSEPMQDEANALNRNKGESKKAEVFAKLAENSKKKSTKKTSLNQKQSAAQKDVSFLQPKITDFQSTGPMTYKLASDVVASIESKLSSKQLPELDVEGSSGKASKAASKKDRRKAKKKKK